MLGGAFLLMVLGNVADPRHRNVEAEMSTLTPQQAPPEETGVRG